MMKLQQKCKLHSLSVCLETTYLIKTENFLLKVSYIKLKGS